MTGAEVLAYTRKLMTPGAPIVVPPRVTRPGGAPPAGVKPGAFDRACAECHGKDGTATSPEEEPDELTDHMKFKDLPRNYTREVFRGGSSERDVVTRMLRGIPGSPMPPAEIAPENPEFWEVLDWVRHLNAGVDSEGAVQRRTAIVTKRTAALPASASDAAWETAAATHVPLMPLRRSVDVPLAVDVRALHDGRRVAFRLAWHGTGDALAGAAVRLVTDPAPGLPHRGDAAGTVARWSSGTPSVSAATPPTYVPLSEIPGDRLQGQGAGERTGDGWAVVLSLDLPDAASRDVVLGVWDGAAADGRLHEGTTIRHTLDVRP
jgi:mono/diheme cytochrome c family protein